MFTLFLILGLKEQINEWANMTGFLCALGGVCLQRKSPSRSTLSANSYSSFSSMTISSVGSVTLSTDSSNVSRKSATLQSQGQNPDQRQYCPVTS